MPILCNANNTTIHGGYFTDVRGDHHIVQGDKYVVHGNLSVNESEAGILALKAASALSATHDSFERHPPPKCYPGTRKTALESVDRWMVEMGIACQHPSSILNIEHSQSSSRSPEKNRTRGRILWLHGPAGAGKSAVAQTISEIYAERQQLCASFYFSRGTAGRDSVRQLIPTLAYQIALRIPGMRSILGSAVRSDPSIFEKSLDAQVNQLMIQPFQSLHSSIPERPLNTPFLLLLDGLDECGNRDATRDLLFRIADLLHKHELPLCFLIVSRPESHITTVFRSDAFRATGLTEELSLYADSNYREAALDVRSFLLAEFDRIHRCEKHREFMKFVSAPWPASNIIDHLVRRSGGYFIYVTTAIRFIDEEYHNPVDRLKLVLDASSCGASPFAELDRLYTQILSTIPNRDMVVQILALIFIEVDPLVKYFGRAIRNLDVIECILGCTKGTVRTILRGLQALLRVPSTNAHDDYVESFHASFLDFLLDKERAGSFYFDPKKHHGLIACNILKIISRGNTSVSKSEQYFLVTWSYHASQSYHSDSSGILDQLRAIDRERWIALHDASIPQRWISMLVRAIHWLESVGDTARNLTRQMMLLLDYTFRKALKEQEEDVVIIQGMLTGFAFDDYDSFPDQPQLIIDVTVLHCSVCELQRFMDDKNRSGDIFVHPAVCHGRLALSCMHLLGYPGVLRLRNDERSLDSDFPMYAPNRPLIDKGAYEWHRFFSSHNSTSQRIARIDYSRQYWAHHLALARPGDESIIDCLRAVGKHLVNRAVTCKPQAIGSDTLSVPDGPMLQDSSEDDSDLRLEPTTHEDDLDHAALVVSWLKNMSKPPHDLLQEWTPCSRCGRFHAFGVGPPRSIFAQVVRSLRRAT